MPKCSKQGCTEEVDQRLDLCPVHEQEFKENNDPRHYCVEVSCTRYVEKKGGRCSQHNGVKPYEEIRELKKYNAALVKDVEYDHKAYKEKTAALERKNNELYEDLKDCNAKLCKEQDAHELVSKHFMQSQEKLEEVRGTNGRMEAQLQFYKDIIEKLVE